MNTQDNAKDQATAHYNSVAAMVAALNVDYDRLETLKDELAEIKEEFDADPANAGVDFAWIARNHPNFSSEQYDELAQLIADAGENTDEDRAREAIQNDALEVQVREDWKNPGEDSTPSEFMILLCTGGPAVRIMGDLDEYLTPCRAYIEYQDWGTPWTMLDSTYVSQAILLQYCQQFYFGE